MCAFIGDDRCRRSYGSVVVNWVRSQLLESLSDDDVVCGVWKRW